MGEGGVSPHTWLGPQPTSVPMCCRRASGGEGVLGWAPHEQTQRHGGVPPRALPRMCREQLYFFIDFAASLCQVFPRTLP